MKAREKRAETRKTESHWLGGFVWASEVTAASFTPGVFLYESVKPPFQFNPVECGFCRFMSSCYDNRMGFGNDRSKSPYVFRGLYTSWVPWTSYWKASVLEYPSGRGLCDGSCWGWRLENNLWKPSHEWWRGGRYWYRNSIPSFSPFPSYCG